MIHTFENEQQWLEARRQYVTSTEVSALFGQNPRLTAFELACIKRDPKLDTFDATERTEWGQELQDAIGRRVAKKHGLVLQPLDLRLAVSGACAASGDFMMDIIGDRSIGGPLQDYMLEHGVGMLEIKNVDSLIFKNEWSEDDMPDHIEIQLQAEMHCWDVKWGAVAALVGGNRLELYVRERDPKVCELIDYKTGIFMGKLKKGILPDPIMPQDAGMVIALHQYAEPNKVYDAKDDTELDVLCRLYKELGSLESAAKKRRDSVKASILSRIGDAERVVNCQSFNISASMRPPVEIAAYTREGFRGLNITARKDGRKDKV